MFIVSRSSTYGVELLVVCEDARPVKSVRLESFPTCRIKKKITVAADIYI